MILNMPLELIKPWVKKSLWKCIFQIQHSVNSNSQKLFLQQEIHKTIMAEILPNDSNVMLPKTRPCEEQNEGETIPRMIWFLEHQ